MDVDFLRGTFNKLLLNFTWWVNRKDRFGKNVFEGGFLGLDNIGVFDRSAPLPTGGHLEQADGTAWMALFSQNMLELALELATHDPTYGEMVFKFVEHFYFIASAINQPGADGMWDEEDGFYYDLLRLPDGTATRLKVRSMVGLLPLCATTVIEQEQRERIPKTMGVILERMRRMPELSATMHPVGPKHFGAHGRSLLALVNPGAASPDPDEDARRERVPQSLWHPRAVKVPRGSSVRLPRGWPRTPGRLPAGRIRLRHVRRQLQLARPDLDAGQRHGDQGAAELLRVLRRHVQG